LRIYNCLVKNLTCKTLREKPGEEKKSAVLQKILTKYIFWKVSLISSKDITNIKRNCVQPLKAINMKTKISNIIGTLIEISLYM
jgi:hypothetical protein